MTETAPFVEAPESAEPSALLQVHDLVKTYTGGRRRKLRDQERVLALDGVSFTVNAGELFTLLGPSGCGKTTTLRSIAGLESPDSGTISVGERVLFDGARHVSVPANARRLGMVFQSYAIWPHMSVFKNVAFPLEVLPRSQRPGRAAITERVEHLLEVVELAGFAGRSATKLSGGQQQRLALARALVTGPQLMLLDEPLSNLDAKLRESMRFELKRLQRELGVTAIYVTHDQGEALAMSSRLAVMSAGKIMQIGKPREVYERPSCQFVADFVGATNFVTGTVIAREEGRYCVQAAEGDLWVASDADVDLGQEVTLSLRPEAIALSEALPPVGPVNHWRGRVVNRAFLGDAVDHVVAVGEKELRTRSNPAQSIAPGTDVHLTVGPETIALVPMD